jgi:hypothetical protein
MTLEERSSVEEEFKQDRKQALKNKYGSLIESILLD